MFKTQKKPEEYNKLPGRELGLRKASQKKLSSKLGFDRKEKFPGQKRRKRTQKYEI